jgi:cell division protein FtsW (lipid II flippase)
MRRKKNSSGKISALMWMAFGLIAAILGIIQSAVPDDDNKESKKNWKIIWACYGVLAIIIIFIQMYYTLK